MLAKMVSIQTIETWFQTGNARCPVETKRGDGYVDEDDLEECLNDPKQEEVCNNLYPYTNINPYRILPHHTAQGFKAQTAWKLFPVKDVKDKDGKDKRKIIYN